MKNDEEANITVPTTPTSVSGDVKLGSTPSNPSKLSANDHMSKNSLGLSPECYGYYSSGKSQHENTKDTTYPSFDSTFCADVKGDDTKLYQEYIERGKSAKATVHEADLDIYKNWVGMYNTAVTIPNQLIFESVRDEH